MLSEIYLDTNATTPVWPTAARMALQVMQTDYGNPSSTHSAGLRAHRHMARARAAARRVLGTETGQVVFTSGATEAIQTAVLAALCDVRARRARGEATGSLLVYGATEHKAVPESLAHWNAVLGLGLELKALAVDAAGRHDLDALRALAPHAVMVCTMAANNETGAVSDLPGLEAVMRTEGAGALWLVDCVQALGKLPLALDRTRIDYAAFSGHKLYAPKGIGLLFVRNGAPFTALMAGGGQETGQRSGTENMAGIAAFGTVLEALARGDTFRGPAPMRDWRDRLVAALCDAFPGIVFNTPLDHALPTTLNFSVEGYSSSELLDVFDAAGIRVSAGSACSATHAAPSHVLAAMGLPVWRAASAVRLSFGPLADEAFIAEACARIAAAGAAIRAGHLAQSGIDPRQADGIVQLAGGAQCSWLLLDADSRSAVLLYPRPALETRVQRTIRSLGYTLQARIAPDQTLSAPAATRSVRLADGGMAPALQLGSKVLVQVDRDGCQAWLYGATDGDTLAASAVRCAFGPPGPAADACAGVLGPDTVWCPERDEEACVATIPGRQRSPGSGWALSPQGLATLLASDAAALLVDVREPAEFHAQPPGSFGGRAPVNLPLSRLADQLRTLLDEPERTLIFVCRSGGRSENAARCLRLNGHRRAWTLAGGMALAGVDTTSTALAEA